MLLGLIFQEKSLLGCREAGKEYARAMEKLAFTLLELISLTLSLPAKRLNGFFHGQSRSTFIRLNHYPPCPASHLALGVGRHKDGGALTILAQDDVGGLDVKRKSDGEWVRVKPIPNSYIINVGDIIQVRSIASAWTHLHCRVYGQSPYIFLQPFPIVFRIN